MPETCRISGIQGDTTGQIVTGRATSRQFRGRSRDLGRAFTLILGLWLGGAALGPAAHADDAAIAQILQTRIEHTRTGPAKSLQVRDLTLSTAVSEFYELRHFAPAWSEPARADALLQALDDLRADGLNPEDYQLTALLTARQQLRTQTLSAQQQADFDQLASRAYLRALAHLFRGKVNPTTLDPQWNFSRNDIAAATALAQASAAVDSGNISTAFAQARPQHALYSSARKALAQLQQIATSGGWPQINTRTTLKPGQNDPQVIVLRQRLAVAGYLQTENNGSDYFDEELAAAVKQFQLAQYLDDDGAVGPSTRAALNVPIAARIDQVRVNLERGRWLLHNASERFVMVDVAGFKAYYIRAGQVIWQAAVQVGKPYRSTPIFKSRVTYITFNPTWTVPPTIYTKDILPKIRRDIGYLAENHMRVLDAHGKEIEPSQINWNKPGNITLRADAGPDNPLGRAVIRFPNPYSVYMHDTSHPELFAQRQRAFSSGCIRVERPLELVELLMDDAEKWNRENIDSTIATGVTRNVDLKTPVPLLLAYWTIDAIDGQPIAFRPDIYERDGPVLQALNERP